MRFSGHSPRPLVSRRVQPARQDELARTSLRTQHGPSSREAIGRNARNRMVATAMYRAQNRAPKRAKSLSIHRKNLAATRTRTRLSFGWYMPVGHGNVEQPFRSDHAALGLIRETILPQIARGVILKAGHTSCRAQKLEYRAAPCLGRPRQFWNTSRKAVTSSRAPARGLGHSWPPGNHGNE